MPKLPEPIIINAPRQGIAPSPYTGYADVRNLDIFTTPGVAKLSNLMAKESASVVDAQVLWMVRSPGTVANFYAVDENGSVYSSTDSGDTWTELSDRTGAGQGAVIWKDYLFVATDTGLDVYGPISGGATWTTGWQTIDSDTIWHPMIISKNDGKIYGGAGRYIFSIGENSGSNFAPGTSATYTFTQQALDLPEDYRIKSLEELRDKLMIGTWVGTNIYDFRIADIFPWDRVSPSFNKPLQIKENGANALLTIGNKMYIFAGTGGAVYATDGFSVQQIAQIPNSIADLDGGKHLEPFPGAVANFKGRPFFGVSGQGTNATGGVGVYSLMETSRGTILVNEHLISTGNSGASNVAKVSALLPVTRDQLLVGWRDNATYGVDMTTVASRATSYSGFFDSPLYSVGTNLEKRQFTKMEIQMAKDLATNEGIKISYRVNLTDSFTAFATTYDFATLGAVNTHTETKIPIPATEFIQLEVALTGTTTTPHFVRVILT